MSYEPLNNEQIEPSSPLPINTTGSELSNMPPEAPESPKNADTPVSLNNDNRPNEPISTPSPEESKPEELPVESVKTEEIPKPEQTSETQTGQIPVFDPLPSPASAMPNNPVSVPPTPNQRDLWRKFLDKIQIGKRKKLDRIMTLFLKQSKITNDEVEKLLRVSDKTAERYLNTLKKENKIKQIGKTGHAINYIKF